MMKSRLVLGLVAVVFAFGCSAEQDSQNSGNELNASPNTAVDINERIAELENTIPQLMDSTSIPGLSIALIKDGEIQWQHGFGVKNADTGEQVDENTVFEAASLSKPVFAYAVLKLVDQGILELDTPLFTYAPESYIEEKFLGGKIDDERFRQITARMVLTHSPGFPNWRGNGPLTINSTPGERFSYSGEGFVYLQRIVEHITGKPLAEFMQESVLVPLGMTHSSYIWKDEYETLAASRHNLLGRVSGIRKNEEGNAAASLNTTAGDYARFLLAIMNGNGLKKETSEEMLEPQIKTSNDDPDGIYWGLGIGLQQTDDGTAFWHWGDNGDSKCFTFSLRESGIGFVYFTNSANGLAIVADIVNMAMGGTQPVLATSLIKGYIIEDTPARTFAQTIAKKGVDEAISYYRELAGNDQSTKESISENLINRLGYALMNANEMEEAIKLFKLNIELYPESANVYDSLGEAYMNTGDKENAIKFYKKALEKDPEFPSAIRMLKQLESEK